ncbi:MAG: polynucleotide adenylyltransferase PcnB [Spirochaetes bacterium]|nr:polynucleotide adenylyltransferase PcnB [Spirochaetota bacterium]
MKLLPALFRKKYPIIVPQTRHSMSRKHIERNVLDIMQRLKGNGYDAFLVGGCVRDLLLDKKPKDFDIVTNARPQQIKRLFRRCFLIGRRFRLAHVYISHDRFVEVATFRAAVDPDEVVGEGRFAANNQYGTIAEDALRRDFTVNGLYYDSTDGSIHDYGGGLEDLKKKTIRSIGDPAKRFAEDPVRIIRAARFCAQLGFTLSRRDFKAAIGSAHMITQANAHRMLEELYKILRSGASAGTMENLKNFRILQHWLPELSPERHAVLLPRLAAVDRRRAAGEEIPPAVLLAALFYDLFDEAMGEKRGFQDVFSMMHQRFNEVVTRLKIPRREWDAITNLIARQSSFTRTVSGPKGKGFEKRFVRNAHFANSLMFFEIFAEASGKYQEELKYWKERGVHSASHEGARHQHQGGEQRPEPNRQRPEGVPGRQGGKSGKRRRNRRPHRPAGPAPAAGE